MEERKNKRHDIGRLSRAMALKWDYEIGKAEISFSTFSTQTNVDIFKVTLSSGSTFQISGTAGLPNNITVNGCIVTLR